MNGLLCIIIIKQKNKKISFPLRTNYVAFNCNGAKKRGEGGGKRQRPENRR